MTRATVQMGEKEYAFSKMPAFQGNSILLKLQKIVLPVIGAMTSGDNSKKGLLDMDVREASMILASHLDDSTMSEIVLPMFKLAQVADVTDGIKLESGDAINKSFTVDTLPDLYELIYLVLRHNFEPFFIGLANRFGLKNGSLAAPTK